MWENGIQPCQNLDPFEIILEKGKKVVRYTTPLLHLMG